MAAAGVRQEIKRPGVFGLDGFGQHFTGNMKRLDMNLFFDRMVLDNIVWLRLVCTKKIKRPGVFGLDGLGQHFTAAAVLQENQETDSRVCSESIIFRSIRRGNCHNGKH